jgi:hypothetical protein
MLVMGCIIDAPPPVDGQPPPGRAVIATEEAIECRAPERAPDVVVVITLDGVRWQEVFIGVERDRARAQGLAEGAVVDAATLMPNLHWLSSTRGAAIGAPNAGAMYASGPNFVSLPGYFELFSGNRKGKCTANDCRRVEMPTLADELARDGDPGAVAVFASWPQLARAASIDPDRILLSAGRGGTNKPELFDTPTLAALAEQGDAASPKPGHGAYRPDGSTAALGLAYLRSKRPRFLFVGLGDPDEHAHHDDYAAYLGALREADAFIGEVAVSLSAMSASGASTLLVVTTDHGRADGFTDHGARHPESARVWLVAAGDSVRARGRVRSPQPRYLADVTATIRVLGAVDSQVDHPGAVLSELFATPEPLLAFR